MKLRRATMDDARLLFDWANDPVVRAAAFDTKPIPWETHCAWLRERLSEPDTRVYIAENDAGTPLGQIRFERKPDAPAEVDVHVAPGMRGQGTGSELISLASAQYRRDTGCITLLAIVKPENTASIRAFEKAGYARRQTDDTAGNHTVQLSWKA